MGNNDEKSVSPEDRELFHKITQEIKDNPGKYHEAGKWLDEYCSEEAYWRRQEKELEELRRKERDFPVWPIPKCVRELEEKMEDRGTPPFLSRFQGFQEARNYLLEKYKDQQFVPDEGARRVILITWLLTDPDAEKADLGITKLEEWLWEPIDDVLEMSRSYAQFLWREGGRVYDPWIKLVRIAWAKLNEGTPAPALPATTNNKHTLTRSFLGNLLRACIKHLPMVGPFLYDVIFGTPDTIPSQKKAIRKRNLLGYPSTSETPKAAPEGKVKVEKWFQNRTIQAALIGACALVVVSMLGWLITLHINKPREHSVESNKVSEEDKVQISLSKIVQDIDSRPLLQQDETAKQYIGLEIQNESILLIDVIESARMVRLMMVLPEQVQEGRVGGRYISCTVQRDKYPQLVAAKRGAKFRVSGEITGIDPVYIHLSNVSLSFE
jgi:hypothetical protein